jgi:hypothetical protein
MTNRFYALVASLIIVTAIPAATNAATVYNSAPTVGFHYGTGNDYSPANAAVLTGTNELSLRFHQTGQVAPASNTSGVYMFALGTTPISFDWGISSTDAFASSASITVSKVGTVQTATYDPFFVGNDNYVGIAGTAQNSARINFSFLLGSGFTPNVDSTYRVTLSYGQQSLSVDAQLGAGAPAAAAVPEPASWALMLVGFGAVGVAARRSSKNLLARTTA